MAEVRKPTPMTPEGAERERWARYHAGKATIEDAGWFAAELSRAWNVHRGVRELVWPLARTFDGSVFEACANNECVHEPAPGYQGHAKCLAARILIVLNGEAGDLK